MNPLILSDNRFADSVPSANATAVDFDARHLVDGREYTFWKGDAVGTFYLTANCPVAAAADSLALCGHNLGTAGASVSLEGYSASTWSEIVAPFIPTDDRPLLKTFNSQSCDDWRLKIVSAAVVPELAVLLVGERLDFPQKPESPYIPYTEDVEETSAASKAGHQLGSLVKFFPISITASFRNIGRSWVLDSYQPFWESHARWRKPFIYAWDLDLFPQHVFWVRHVGKFATPLSISSRVDSLALDLKGVRS